MCVSMLAYKASSSITGRHVVRHVSHDKRAKRVQSGFKHKCFWVGCLWRSLLLWMVMATGHTGESGPIQTRHAALWEAVGGEGCCLCDAKYFAVNWRGQKDSAWWSQELPPGIICAKMITWDLRNVVFFLPMQISDYICGKTVHVWAGCPGYPLCKKNGIWKKFCHVYVSHFSQH